MHRSAPLALAIGIMIVAGYGVIAAKAWPWKAALFPLAIGIPLFCLAAAEVLLALFGKAPATHGADFKLSEGLPRHVALRRTALAWAWIVGFFVLIVLLGFPLAVPAFVFLYLRLQAKEGWLFCAVFSAALWGAFYGLFDYLLHLPFPDGWVLTWFGF